MTYQCTGRRGDADARREASAKTRAGRRKVQPGGEAAPDRPQGRVALQRIIHGIRFGCAAMAYTQFQKLERPAPAPRFDVSA